MSSSHYQNLVLGSGQSGTPLASALAAAGQRTALIESTHIGGTCINEGCTPTKTMVASARVAYLARRGADYGVGCGDVKVDLETVRKRKREIVESFRGGSERRLKDKENLEWITGTAKFVSAKDIEVTGVDGEKRTVTGERMFVNVGCHPTPLTIPGAEDIEVLNSTSVMELSVVPEHLVVIGGGYVGVEFAQMFRRFGAKVSVIQRSGQLLGKEDVDVAEAVREVLIEDGLEIHFNAAAESVSKNDKGEIELKIKTAEGMKTVVGSHLLAAAGRTPNAAAINIEAAGVKLDKRGFIVTNPELQTNIPHIYALGDIVSGNPNFTHISYDDFRIIRDNLVSTDSKKKRTKDDRMTPYTVFMDPQLGRIGLGESAARKEFPAPGRVKVAKMPMAYVARALEMDESRGLIKIIVDGETEKILGAAIFGIEGGEVMTMVQMAMIGGLSYKVLQDAVFSHPGLGELLNNVWGSLE